jgi:hypothetical protein
VLVIVVGDAAIDPVFEAERGVPSPEQAASETSSNKHAVRARALIR